MLADILGVLGFFLAVLSVSWEIWRYRNDNKEMLRVCQPGFLCDPDSKDGALSVTVINTGRVPVYIASISLYWQDDDGCTGLGMVPLNRNVMNDPKANTPLEPGEGRDFALRHFTNDEIHEALSSKIWISVSSHRGELARMEDRAIRHILVHIQERRKMSVDF